MRNRKAITMTGIILLFVSTFCSFLSTAQLISQSKDSRPPNWNDKNGNNIDDLIDDANSMGPFDIFIDYGVHPNQTHLNTLNVTIFPVGGYISSVYRYIDTVGVRNVPQVTIDAIASLPDVTMVWKQPEVKSFLNTSVRAIKARCSSTYNDEYVWSGSGDAGDNITRGEGITIAVLDTGVDDEHDSLTGKFVAGFDATKFEDLDGDGDDDIYIVPGGPAHEPADGSTNPDDMDVTFNVFHGTHCASTALGDPSDDVYMGVAPEARLVDIKVLTALGTGSMDDVIEGIEWAQSNCGKDWGVPGYEGIDVLSISLGSSNASDGSDPCSRAVNNAVEAGIVAIVAAGNDGPDNDGLGAPAAADLAITVAAVDDNDTVDRSDDTIADFSSRGPRDDDGDTDPYDELKPEAAAHGVDVMAARGSNIPGGAGTVYHELSGTSMATPHVAGVAALILSYYESIGTSLTPEQVDEILRYTAEDKDGTYNPTLSNKYDVAYGWGIVDAYWAIYPHDIAVTAVTTSQTWVIYGDSLQIDVTVENLGGFPAMSRTAKLEIFNVSIYYDFQHIETKLDISLLPGNEATIPFTWDTASCPIGEHTISARASVVPLEFETSDNYFTDGTVFVLQPLKIGIIGPVGWPHWSPGMKEAAEMARDEINAAGGIDTGSGYYGVKLIFGDERSYPSPEPIEAAFEMERLCDPAQEGCDFVIGGFNTECTTAMIEVAADYGVPFFINGASSDSLMDDTVGTDYLRYKYLFRINPVNTTMMFQTVAASIAYYLLPFKLNPLFGHDLDNNPATPNQTKVAVLSEDLAWTIEMHTMLTHPAYYPGILGPYANVTYADRIPDGTTDVSSWIQSVIDSEARLLIHIFSGISGVPVIATWKAMDCGAMPVGINVLGQLQTHWSTTSGGCEYETIFNVAGTRTPIVPGLTEVFWDNFVARTGVWPLHTAWGAYDGIYGLKEALEDIGIIDKDLLVDYYENPSYERQALNGRFKYTSTHDVYSNEPGPLWTQEWSRAFVVQWLSGRMEVVSPMDKVYSKKWNIPPWMYPLIEDINYDGKVDMRDVGGAARAFGSYPGHERWEKEADINHDDEIDMRDIGGIARKFGETISLPLDYP